MPRVTVCPTCTSVARFAKFAPTVTRPVASSIQRYPSTTGLIPDAGHTRPPSFVTVTLTRVVCPDNQVRPTVSLTQSALQSAERKLMSRNGLLYSVFHQEPPDWRSQ